MWFDINIHLPHHLAPKIPWYHLRRAAEAIKASHPEWYQERHFSFGYLLASWRKPLIKPVEGEEYFEMSRFER
jgi:omega-6 fatty acid desaturase (delta-12 desaturase)